MTDTEAASTTQTAAVAEQGADVASEKAFSKKDATQKKGAPKGRKGSSKAREAMMADGVITPDMKKAKIAKVKATAKSTAAPKAKQPEKAAKPAKPAAEASEGSKKSIILGLLRRKDGATMAELAEASGWQNHYADIGISRTASVASSAGAWARRWVSTSSPSSARTASAPTSAVGHQTRGRLRPEALDFKRSAISGNAGPIAASPADCAVKANFPSYILYPTGSFSSTSPRSSSDTCCV